MFPNTILISVSIHVPKILLGQSTRSIYGWLNYSAINLQSFLTGSMQALEWKRCFRVIYTNWLSSSQIKEMRRTGVDPFYRKLFFRNKLADGTGHFNYWGEGKKIVHRVERWANYLCQITQKLHQWFHILIPDINRGNRLRRISMGWPMSHRNETITLVN